MADYVDLIKYIKTAYNAEDKAVVTFGGSYGGMLSAWIRMKYPHVFQGALAASAPIEYFKGAPSAPEWRFAEVASNDFKEVSQNCYDGIKDVFTRMEDKKDDAAFRKILGDSFNTCTTVDSAQNATDLLTMLQNGYLYMAMTDYPYAASFLNIMPAWPVNASCAAFIDWASGEVDQVVVTRMKKAADIYFNYNNHNSSFCYDFGDTDATGTLAAAGWNVLACNELAMPTSMGLANSSMFVKTDSTFDYDGYTAECEKTYGLTPKYDWALQTFGSYDYTRDFKDYSNIIFSNGKLDPWMAGGITDYIGKLELPVYLMNQAAHHLDLRLPNKDDPPDVVWVREQEAEIIGQWIADY